MEGFSAAEVGAAEPAREAPPSETTASAREEDVARPSRAYRVRHALVHLVLPVAFAVGVGLLGSTLGLTVAGQQTVSLGPFRVELSGGVGKGVTDIALPPVGRITADTHLAPLRFRATLQDIQIQRLTTEIREKGIDSIVDEVESDTKHRVVPFALRLLAIGILGGLLAGAVVFRHHWKLAVITVATSLVATAGSEVVAWQTYNPSALLSPTFHGSIALAPKFIGPAQTAIDQIDKVRAGLSRVVDGALGVFLSVQGTPLDTEDEIRVLHISDIHLSPLGMAFAQQVAEAFRVNFVIDTGDITSFGTPAENLILSEVPRFNRPYVFVRGNHDSAGLQAAMKGIKNAVVLDGIRRTVDGLLVYGRGDPAFTPNKQTAGDDAQIAATIRSAAPLILHDIQGAPRPPDIVAVHDDRMAEDITGLVPLVISGHFHQQSAGVVNGTIDLRIGSTGGAGANVFTEEGGVPLSAEILYFSKSDHALVAYDLISQSPETGSLTVKRQLVGQVFGSPVPSPPPPTATATPTPTPTPSAAESLSPPTTVLSPSPS